MIFVGNKYFRKELDLLTNITCLNCRGFKGEPVHRGRLCT